MDTTVSCPACGALLSVSSKAGEVDCQYCGNHFHIDQSQVTPGLQPQPREELNPDQMGTPDEMGMNISAETESREPALPSPQPEIFPPAPQPRPYMPPPPVQEPRRNNKIWITIAVVIGLVLFAMCACMIAVSVLLPRIFSS